MKNFYTLLLGLLLGASAIGQETPAITLTTTKTIGSDIMFYIKAKSDNILVKIDYGDGVLIEKMVA